MTYIPGCLCPDCKRAALQERMNPTIQGRYVAAPDLALPLLKEATVMTEAQLEASIAKQKEELRKLKALGEDNYPVGTLLYYEDADGKFGTGLKHKESAWMISEGDRSPFAISYESLSGTLAKHSTEIFIVTELTKIA